MYGRARRIALVKAIMISLGIVLVVCISLLLIFKKEEVVDYNQNFEFLKNYLNGKGYSCEMIQKSGGKCILNTDVNYYSFTRYVDGFEYLVKSDAYSIEIRFTSETKNNVVFKTTSDALLGYKNSEYICELKSGSYDEISSCEDNNGKVLDMKAYLGAIDSSLYEVNNILKASGYDIQGVLVDHVWKK